MKKIFVFSVLFLFSLGGLASQKNSDLKIVCKSEMYEDVELQEFLIKNDKEVIYRHSVISEGRVETEESSCIYHAKGFNKKESYVDKYFYGADKLVCIDKEEPDWPLVFALFGGEKANRHAVIIDEDTYISLDTCKKL